MKIEHDDENYVCTKAGWVKFQKENKEKLKKSQAEARIQDEIRWKEKQKKNA